MGVVARWLHDDFLEALHAGLMWVFGAAPSLGGSVYVSKRAFGHGI